MQIRFLSLFCGLFCFAGLCAQQKDFPLMYSYGKIPTDFLVEPEEAAKKKIEAIKAQAKIVSQAEVDYIYVREYTFSHYITEGVITYGDLISSYNDRIVNRLLKNEPELRNKIKVYLLRSDEARLVSFDQGTIFVSTALFSKIENEAQMAYLLAREIIHIRENHAHDYFISNYLSNTGKIRYEDRVSVFSAEQEAEADKKALRLCLDAGYAIGECVKALDALSKFDESFGEIKFDIAFFEHDDYVFPDEYQLAQVKATEADSLALQLFPNLENRIKELRQYIGMFQQTDGVTEFERAETFLLLQTYAREETIRMYCIHQKTAHAIYGAYVILKSDSTNTAARRTIAYCLAVKAIYESPDKTVYPINVIAISNKRTYENYTKEPKTIDEIQKNKYNTGGEIQRVNHFLSSLSNPETVILALYLNWETYRENTNNSIALEHSKILMNILKANYDLHHSNFAKTPYFAISNDSILRAQKVGKNTTRRPIIDPDMQEQIHSNNSLNSFIKKQETQINEQARAIGLYDNTLRRTNTTKITPKPKFTAWRKATPNENYNDILYNYYEYCFINYNHDSLFLDLFNRAPDYISQEKTYRMYDATPTNELNENSGLGKDKFLPGYLFCKASYLDLSIQTSYTDVSETQNLYAMQSKSLFFYSIYSSNTAYDNIFNLSESDSMGFSIYCIYRTVLSDLYNHVTNQCTLSPGVYGDITNTIVNYYKTNIVLTSHIFNLKTSKGFSCCKIVSQGVDLRTGRIVLYWHEEHAQSVKQHLLNTHYKNVKRKILQKVL